MKPSLSKLWEIAHRAGRRRFQDLSDQLVRDHTRIAELETQNQAQHQIIAALERRLAHLEAHNAALTDAATTRERQLQAKAELDYQILMIHQQLLAELQDAEPRFQPIYEQCKPFSMTSIERLYGLYKSVEYLIDAAIPGDLAECGVWRGGSCMMMAATLLETGKCDRRILMFDTFEGHPAPDPERDVDLWGNRAHAEWQQQTNSGTVKGWGLASLEEVRQNLRLTGYPDDKLTYVKGMVEDTAPTHIPEALSLLRLDTDWYNSTRAALVHFYPRLASGGVLILDDYGHYKGQRQAVDEYFREKGERLLFHRIDYSCRVAIKR